MKTAIAVLVLLTLQSAARAAEIPGLVITSPAPFTVLSGPISFAVSGPSLTNLATIEYWLNGKRFSGRLNTPYTYPWHAAYGWNGPYVVEAVGRDSAGNEIARSPAVDFRISTMTGGLTLLSPETFYQALSGQVVISAKAIVPPGKQLERILIAIDGYQQPPYYASTFSYSLDTTSLSNGKHEIVIAAFENSAIQQALGMLQFPIQVDNGHAFQQIRANWRYVYLAPGEAQALQLRQIFTDATEEPVSDGAVFSSDNPAIASVDDAGLITGVSRGFARITASFAHQNTTVQVIVNPVRGFAHFSRDGIIGAYDPSRSMFLRTLFFLDYSALAHSPDLAGAAQNAAINALTEGLYINPADGNQPATFESWREQWDAFWGYKINAAEAYDLSFFFTGDDMARTSAELADSVGGAYSTQAIQYALAKARDSHRAIAIDMVDEVSYIWGDTPTPQDGRWLRNAPPVADNSFQRLMSIINTVPDRVPVSWPILGKDSGYIAGNWMGNPAFSDYVTHYWTYFDNRFVYPWGASLNQDRANLDRTVETRFPFLDPAKPVLFTIGITGDGYTKLGPGTAFVPGQDEIDGSGNTPIRVAAQIMYAVARSAAGVRAYAYDQPAWQQTRSSAKLGTHGLQQGSDPFGVGWERWQAMSAAFNLIQLLEPDLLQPPMNAIDLGPDILTGAKQGNNSRVLMAINFSEAAHSETINLAPYSYKDGTVIERYRQIGADVLSGTIPGADTMQQEFEPGEIVIWVFRPAPAPTP